MIDQAQLHYYCKPSHDVRYSVPRGHTLSTFRTDQPLLRKEWGFFIGRSIAIANSLREAAVGGGFAR